MRYISLFSGVEAATLAWEPLGWEAVAFAEIEPFPSAVLAHRWPDVPNLGDVTKVDWSKYRGTVDLVVGGSPCQAFSVAGKREGLLDERGQLMLEYVRAVREVEPRWFLWENVTGVLSQDGGRAFGTLLREMDELGYGMAWRVLDAQFFGVAQRRRRVFLVGCAGGGGAPAAVLFEPESVSGNTQTSKQKREALAADARSGSTGAGECLNTAAYSLQTGHTGALSGALAAQPGMKQQTYVAEARAYRSDPLSCPICGSESVVSIDDPQEPESFWRYSCGCSQLGCELYGRLRKSFDNRGDAIADWNKSVLLNCYSVDYKQTPKFNDQVCHTLTHEGDGGIHSAVAYPEPVVMASAHTNAEIGEGGGHADPHSAHRQGCACTSNGADVFPALCATDGDKQFIDNQSVSGGRLIIQSGDSDGGRQRQDCGGRGDVRLTQSWGSTADGCLSSNGDDVIGALCARDSKGVGSQYASEGKVILSWGSK